MKKDNIVGRPIRLNKQILNPNGKGFSEVMFIGDCHLGSPQFDKPRFTRMLDFCLKHKFYVFLMGDLLEIGTKTSVGAGVFEQEFKGQTQYEQMAELLYPLAKKKLILGSLNGNHCERIYQATGVNVAKMLARELEVPYLGNACWNSFKVGSQNYSIYSLHGRSGARFDGTALLALERISTSFFADLVVMGHAHKLISSSVIIQKVERGSVKQHKKNLLITGSYLKYDDGYAQTVGLPLSKLGSPKVRFYADKKDIRISMAG